LPRTIITIGTRLSGKLTLIRMLTAIRQSSDKTKVVGEFIEKVKGELFKCEFCDSFVIHNKPKDRIKIGHFKHKPGESDCPNRGESIEHIRAKLGIFEYVKSKWGEKLQQIEIEKWICNKTIRPDIYIETKKGNKIAIEVQASALTVEEIKRRTSRYFDENIYVMWILLFERPRFYIFRKEWGTKDDGNWGLIDARYFVRDSVRLKEFELFLYRAYNRALIFWDLEQNYSTDFMVIQMADYWTADKEFRKDGEDYFYEGKQTKVMKTIQSIKKDVSFDKLRPIKGSVLKGKSYDIPERTIFGFETEPKKRR